MTRAARKAENRITQAHWFTRQQRAARLIEYGRAIEAWRQNAEDTHLAACLGVNQGPGRAAMATAYRRAEMGKGDTDTREAFLAVARRALIRWKAQAGAIEHAIRLGNLAVRGAKLVRYRGDGARVIERANVYALVALCATIEANLAKPHAVRITFTGKVNPQVLQTTARLTDGECVCPVAEVTRIVPLVRAKVRQYHGEAEVGLRMFPCRTFALRALCA